VRAFDAFAHKNLSTVREGDGFVFSSSQIDTDSHGAKDTPIRVFWR